MDTNSWYWAPHPTEGYMPVKIKQTAEGFIARIQSTNEQFIVQKDQIMPAHESSLEPCDNLVSLQELTEPALLHNLRTRFSQDIIYTWISSILISVNPFKQLPIYSTHVMAKYREGLAQHKAMSPHVFTVADNAFKDLTRGGAHGRVSIIISGESGAGKSEAMKVCMSYLAEIAASNSGLNIGDSSAIADRVLSTNPILEAFGNAKTVRNNNSSRFGKLIKLCFSNHAEIAGAHIESYLLEKSRIVQQAANERNYHIFYQLFIGLSDKEKKEYGLTHPADFVITQGLFDDASSGDKKAAQKLLSSYTVDGIDDKEEFYRTQKAFEQIGINNDEQRQIYRVTAGCLHLGNVEFQPKGSDSCEITSNSQQSLRTAATLLGLDVNALSKALVSQLKQMGKDYVTTNKNKATAESGLFACVKEIYAQQFDWLIEQMNKKLAPQTPTKTFIGILDIFGFEVFQVNSFEQLCINFTNEKMQSHFNQHVFKLELEEYKAEQLNLDVSSVSYVDNQPCLDLIETGRQCILALCDEELRTPKGTDETLLEKMHQQLSSNKFYIKPKQKGIIFGVQHYAGQVDYTISNFMVKNKDQLDIDLANALASSSLPYMKTLMAPLTDAAKVASTTLGKKFKDQLGNLMKVLNDSTPHFIRCIKSNNLKIGDTFSGDMVLGQMRYLGLREVVLIRQQGYPIRRPFMEFLQRYKLLLPSIVGPQQAEKLISDQNKNAVTMIKTILSWCDNTETDWKLGKSKIFYRMQIQTKLEQARDQALSAVVLELQTHIRCKLERTRFLRRNQVLILLRQAASSNDLKLLENVIDQCERISVSPNGNSEMSQLYRTCTDIRNKLSEQFESTNALRRAMSTKDIEMLLLAILSARNAYASILGVKPQVVNVKTVKIDELKENELLQQCPEYNSAIQLVKKLKDFETSCDELTTSRDINQAKYVVGLAKELQLAPGVIARWENLYMQIQEEKKIQSAITNSNSQHEYEKFKKNMQVALSNQVLVLLTVSLQRGQAQGFHHDPLYSQGKQLEQTLQISATTLAKELKFALDSEDFDVITYGVKIAIEKGFSAHNLVQQCKEKLVVLEKVQKVKKALQDALISPKRVVLEQAIADADTLGGLILDSEEYRQAQKALIEMKEKQKKFNHRASIHARRSIVGQAPPSLRGNTDFGGDMITEGDEDFDPDAIINNRNAGGIDIWSTATVDELQIALAEAESAGLDDAQVKQIKRRLNALQSQKQAIELLQNAVDSSNVRMLETAIDRAEKSGISLDHELLSRALRLRKDLRDKKAARAGATNVTVQSLLTGENLLSLTDLGLLREVNIDKYCDQLFQSDWYTDSMYSLQQFPFLRSAAEFLKSAQYTENDKIAMYKHQQKEINNTMIQIEAMNTKNFLYDNNLGAENHININKLQSFVAHSTSLFKSIQAYMFDRKLSFPESLIAELILTCQSYPQFRDEVYIMILKQLTDNPHIPSLLQGWRLLSILTRYISPSPTFFPYIMRYIYSHTQEAQSHHDMELRVRLNHQMTQVEQTTLRNTAAYALTMLPMTFKESLLVAADLSRRNVEHHVHHSPAAGASVVGTTGQPVSSDKATTDGIGRYDQAKVQELIAVITGFASKSMMPVLMHIYFPDDSAIGMTVSPWDTPQTIVQRACQSVGITDTSGLWLYENYKEKNYALLPYENPIDIQRTWLDKSQKKRKLFTTTKQSKFSRFRAFVNDSLSSISEPNTIQGRNGLIVNKSGKRKIVIRRRTCFAPIQLSYDKLMNTLLFFQTVGDINNGLHHLHQDSAAMLARMTQILLPNLTTFASQYEKASPPPPPPDDDDDIPPPPPPDAMLANNNIGPAQLMSGEAVEIDEKLPLEPPTVNLVKKHAPQCPPNLLVGKNKITTKKFFSSVDSVQLDLGLLSLEQYVATVMQLTTFAASFFFLEQTFDPSLPKEIILAVNQTGIFVLDGQTRASLEQYSLMQTLGWSSGPNRLTLHVKLSKPDKQGKTTRALRFDTERTSIGQEVCQLLMAFAKDFLEKMQQKAASPQ